MGSPRINGKALSLTLGGQDVWADITSVTLGNDDGDNDTVTFEDAANGGSRVFTVAGTALASTATGSFWRQVWDNSGTDVAFRFSPNGNTAATADKPHFIGTLNLGPKPAIGGDANKTQTFDFSFEVDGEPELDDGGSATAIISTISPNADLAVGDSIAISGTRFTGATGVTVDGIAADFVVVSNTIIAASIPAGAAGEAPVVVTNADGDSAAVNVTLSA